MDPGSNSKLFFLHCLSTRRYTKMVTQIYPNALYVISFYCKVFPKSIWNWIGLLLIWVDVHHHGRNTSYSPILKHYKTSAVGGAQFSLWTSRISQTLRCRTKRDFLQTDVWCDIFARVSSVVFCTEKAPEGVRHWNRWDQVEKVLITPHSPANS